MKQEWIVLDEEAKKYIVLLLGIKDDPVPSLWHLQKEMFMVSKAVPKAGELFDFRRHYNGPFSQMLQEITNEPLYYDGAYMVHQNRSVSLTESGRDLFEKIIAEYRHNKKFSDLLKTIRLTREIYDKLGKDELLFLIYQTYPEYIDASNIYDRLVANKERPIQLADSLSAKGLITDERREELKEIEQ